MKENFSSGDVKKKLKKSEIPQKKANGEVKKLKMKKIDYIVYLLVVCAGILSHIYFQKIRDYLLLNDYAIVNVKDQVQLGSQILFYFCIISLGNMALSFLMEIFTSGSVRYCVNSSLERVVIVVGMYLFLLNKKLIRTNEQYFIITVNWFLLSQCLLMIGIVFDSIIKSNIRYAGFILMVPMVVLTMNKIAKYNGFPSV